jgi:O-antigen ligase
MEMGMPQLSNRARPRRKAVRPARDHADALLWSLALMNVTYVWRLPSIIPGLKPLRFGIVTGVLACGLFLLDRSPRRRLLDLPMAPVRLTVAFLSLMVLSVPTGLYPSNSAIYLAQNVIPTMLLMIMLATSLRSIDDVEWFALVNMAAAAGYCLFVLWVFRVGRSGRLEELIYYDGNDLALLLVATLPLAGYFMTHGHRWTRQVLAAISALLFLFLLVRTGSRGAFVGMLVMATYLLLYYRGFSRTKRLAALLIVAFFFIVLGGASYISKIQTILNPTADYNWSGRSNTGRLEIWKRGLGYVADRPLLGVGVHNFEHAEGNLSDIGREMQARGLPFKWSVAHNSYLETAAEAGIAALVIFVGLFWTTFKLLRRVTRITGRLPFISRELILAQALGACLLGYLVCAFFLSAEYFVYPYVLLGLAIGLAKTTLRSQGQIGAAP